MGSGNGNGNHHHVPKGYLAILVGLEEKEENLHRFVIPVFYINHPLFLELLKEAEAEYGFDHKGPITIPCGVEDFRVVQDTIVKDFEKSHHHHHRHRHEQYHHHHHIGCFRV